MHSALSECSKLTKSSNETKIVAFVDAAFTLFPSSVDRVRTRVAFPLRRAELELWHTLYTTRRWIGMTYTTARFVRVSPR